MTTPTTLPEALTEIEELRGQVRELLRLLGQEATQDARAAGVSTTEITGLNDPPEISFSPVSFQRKQTEHEQAQTLAEIRNVIETLPDVIFKLDLRGNLAGWNQRLETVTGLVPEELKGRPALSFVPEGEHEQTAAAILRAFEEGYAELEGHLLTKDQRAIPYHWTGAALRNDEGQVVGITGVGRDVSEKKRIEAELRRQQQHLLAAQAMAHVGSWDWDIVSGVMEWSEEQFRIFGYEPKAIPPTCGTFLAALHPDDHDRVAASINDMLEGKTSLDVECRVVRPDGEIRTVHYLGRMIRAEDSSPVRLAGSTLDITDRTQAESVLRLSESHFRAMIENSSDIITVLDLDGTIRFESPSFEHLLGYTQHEIDGRIAFDFIHPDDLPTVLERFQLIVQRPGETHTAEFRFRHRDGSWRQFEGVGRAARDSQDRPCVIVNSRDITERKRAERSLLQTRDLLTSFVENTPAAVAMLDRELRYVAVSRRWLTDYRLVAEPLVGRRHYDVFPEIQDMKEWQEIHQRCLSGSVERREEDRFVRADGSEDWLRWEVRPWHGVTGEIGGVIMFTEVITERKRAEFALQESDRRFNFAVEATNDGIWDWDIRTGAVYFSPQWMRLLGYSSDDVTPSTEFFFSILHPDDRARTAQVLQEHLDARIPVKQLEIRLRQKSGDYRWYLDRGKVVVRNQDGSPLRMVGTITDITERKRAEQALAENRQLLDAIVEGLPDAVFAKDISGNYLLCNEATGILVGKNKVEVLGHDDHSIFPPDVAQVLMETDRRIMTNGSIVTYEEMMRTEGGVHRTFLTTKGPLLGEQGQVTGIFGIAREVTEQKKTEAALRASEERLRLAMDIADLATWDWNITTNEVRWSDNCERVKRLPPGSFDGTFEAYQRLIHPEDLSMVRRQIQAALQQEIPYYTEHRLVTPSGSVEWVEANGRVYRDESGQPVRMLGTVRNITERKQTEEALREMNMALAHAMPGISRVAPDGRYQTVNDAYAKALGYTPDELVGMNWERTVHSDDKARALAAYEAMLRNGKGEFEAVAVRKDGTTFWKQVLIVKSVDGSEGGAGHHCFMRDITDRKQVGEALRIGEQSIRELYTLASLPESTFDERIERLLQLGCRRFNCTIGLVTHVREEQLEVAHVWAPGSSIRKGDLLPLQKTYCSVTLGADEPVLFEHAGASEWRAHPAYPVLGFECYLGTKLVGQNQLYGTICFLDSKPRSNSFTQADVDFLQLMARWLSGEIDRQAALTALSESERRYRTLYDETPSMYFTVDEKGIVRSVNDYGAQYLGYRVEDLVGQSVLTVVAGADQSHVLDALQALFRQPKNGAQWEFRKVRADGTVIWVRETVRILQNPAGESLALIVCEDITEGKKAEDWLRASEERFRAAFENAAVGIVLGSHSKGNGIDSVNPALSRLTGYTISELKSIGMKGLTHPDDFAKSIEFLKPLIAGEREQGTIEKRYVKKNGETLWALTSVSTIRNQAGQYVESLALVQDITDRKLAEAQLRTSEEKLRQALHASNTGLWDWNTDTNEVRFSREWKRQLGYEEAELPDAFETWESRLHPEDRVRAVAYAVRYCDNPVGVFRQDFRFLHKDGTYRWIDSHASFVTEPDGRRVRLLGSHTDITERKQVEEALKASEERYARATAVGKVGVWELDVLQEQFNADDNLKALFGYMKDELSTDPFVWLNLVHPDDRPITLEAWDRVSKGLIETYSYEVRMIRKDGSILWTHVRGHANRNEEGSLVRLIGATVDVTDRKRADERLLLTQFSIDRASDAVLWMDSGSHFINVNDAACRMLNYTREELTGLSIHDLDPNVSAESWTHLWEQLKQKGSMTFESRYWSSTGSVVETEITANYLLYNGKEYNCAIVRDVGERKRTEAELRASEERYRTLFDETPTMYFTLATDGVVRSVNRFGAEQLGYHVEELVGHSVLDVFHEEDKQTVAASLSECLKAPEITQHWEFRKVRKDGSVIWVRETVRVGQSSSGEIVVLVACEDVTERKRVEGELHKSHTFMRQVIDTDPNFIFAKDRNGRFTLLNKATADVYGTTVDGLIGKTDADFNLSQEEVAYFRLKDLEVMDTLQERFIPEEKITDVYGNTRWLQTIRRPLLDDQGHVVMILGSSTDITARKRVEEMLRQRERDVRAAIEERERISEDLHDGILQSIFAVGLGLESCRTLVAKLPRKKAATPLMAGLNRAIGQLNHVMTDVRNFIAGIESHVLEEADIGQTLRTMVQAMCASNGTACRVTIEEAAVGELSTEQAYHVMNIMREALSNSLRHSGAGRITLSFKRLRRSVRFLATDNGKGFIPDSVRDLGHGLFNMAARARKLGGRIEVRSRPRQGTKVLLDIPRRLADE